MPDRPKIIMPGVTINAAPIAKGLLQMMETMPDADSYIAALQFGMLPGPLMEIVGKQLTDKAEHLAKPSREKVKAYRTMFEGLDMDEYWDDADKEIATWITDFVKKATREITLAMYEHGDVRV